jgi:YegS/Rv2252/BmrU family lipid kinase
VKTYLIINPHSANGQTGRRWPELEAQVGKAIGDFGRAFTEGPMHACRLAREAIHKGYECIVAVGGDGTVNEVVNGFFEGGRVLNPAAALGLIARGTGGDFRRTFGWALDVGSAVARLGTEETQPFDVGEVQFMDHQGQPATRYFANISSFGASGLVVKTVNESSKALGGKLSFMLGSVRALLKYRDQRVRLTCDDRPAEELPITTVAVANGKYFGGGMQVAPHADTRDGLFHVTIWSGYGLKDFALKQKSIYSGQHLTWSGTRTLECKTFSAEPAEGQGEVLLDVDGEQPGHLPCRMRVLPSAIRLKV